MCRFAQSDVAIAISIPTRQHRSAWGAVQAYLDAAHNEIDIARETIGDGRKLDTVFFGGGTPTLLDTEALGGAIGACKRMFRVLRQRGDHDRGQPGNPR